MEKTNRVATIIDNLNKSRKVASYNREKENESETLAHCFLDIEESCKVMITELFPKLLSDNMNEDDIDEIIYDIGEEFRHVLYHIKDSIFYNYLQENLM